ncbi:MAG: hypothetical protein RR054_02990 [Clostridia bacterium]
MGNLKGKNKLKISFSPDIIVYLLIALGLGQWKTAIAYIISVSVHEPTHFFIAKRLGYKCKELKISVFGAVLYGDFDSLSKRDEINIAISAPLMNILFSLILVAFWWLIPETYNFTYETAIANAVFGLTNLMPCYPLDGGRVLTAMLSDKYGHKKSFLISEKLNVILSAILFSCFIITALFSKPNFSLGIFAFFTAVCAMTEIEEQLYTKALFDKTIQRMLKKGTETKTISFDCETPIFNAYKECSQGKMWLIDIYENKNQYKKIKTLTIIQIENALLSLPPGSTLNDIK